MTQDRPEPTSGPVALFVFSNLREQKGGLTRAWLRRLALFHEAGWQTHVATIHRQPEIDQTLAAWRERGWLPAETQVHHYQRRNRRLRPQWRRPTDDHFTRDDRIADWLDWLVGQLPGALVFADSPVTYAPVAKMRNPYVGRIMTAHLAHRTKSGTKRRPRRPGVERSRYQGPAGQPKLTGRFLPYAPAADAVVALTRRQAGHLAEDVPGAAIHVIPNIVEPPGAQGSAPARQPGRVVCIGRLDPLKRVDDAIRAVALARDRLPGVTLDVYGRGPDLERLEALRDELGLHEVVRFPGFTDDPFGVLAGAQASLLTSRREGFGLVVAESLAVGTPVVTYDVDYGPAELVSDHHTGRVVADGAIEQLANALVDVLTDEEAWAKLSAAGPSAVAHLAERTVAAQWLALADEVRSAVRRPGASLLIEDLRVRRAGVQVLAVAFGGPGQRPATVRLGGSPVPLSMPQEAPGETSADQAGRTVTPGTATLPWALLDALAGTDAAVPRVDGAGRSEVLLEAQDLQGHALPALGPGVPQTVLPTANGVLLARPRADGAVAVAPAGAVVTATVTLSRAEASVDGDVTVLTDVPLVSARLAAGGAHAPFQVTGTRPGLDLAAGSSLALVVRGEHPRILGEVTLSSAAALADPSERWRGTAAAAWDAAALRAVDRGQPVLVSLGIGRDRRRSAGRLLGGGRPVPVAVTGPRWVMATSSDGRLMLVPGRAVRARAAWAARRLLRRGP